MKVTSSGLLILFSLLFSPLLLSLALSCLCCVVMTSHPYIFYNRTNTCGKLASDYFSASPS
jgi:hypothetical protein